MFLLTLPEFMGVAGVWLAVPIAELITMVAALSFLYHNKALCGSPDFLVLGEPVNGLGPQGIVEIRELILRLNQEQQATILISGLILDELSKLAIHYGFVDRGAFAWPIIEFPVPILKGNVDMIKNIREKLYEPEFSDLTVVDFSDLAQGCKTYDEFIEKMKDVSETELPI